MRAQLNPSTRKSPIEKIWRVAQKNWWWASRVKIAALTAIA
jgi:hypothetical protein